MASKRPGLFVSLYSNPKLFGRGRRDSEKAIPDPQNEDLHPDEEDGVASAMVGDEDVVKAGADQESASWDTFPDPVRAKRQHERVGMKQPYGESGGQTPDLPERGLDWHGTSTPDDPSDDVDEEGTAEAKKIWGDPQPVLEEPKKGEKGKDQPVEKAMLPKESLKHEPGSGEVQWSESDRHFENFHPKMAANHAAQAKWHRKQAKKYPEDHPARNAHLEAHEHHDEAHIAHSRIGQRTRGMGGERGGVITPEHALVGSADANDKTRAVHQAARMPYEAPKKRSILQRIGLSKGLEDYQTAQAQARQQLTALPSIEIGPQFSPKEREFLMVKGFTEEDFLRGRVRVTPRLRAEYNQYVSDTVFKSLTGLKDHRR